MKQILMITVLWTSHAFAMSGASSTISCTTQKNLPKGAFQANLAIQAKAVRVDFADKKKEEILLHDVKMTAKNTDSSEVETGRARTIAGAVNPRATKYKEFYTVQMDKLVNVKNFGQYEPLDECFFTLHLPTNMWNKSRFDAPVVTHCDHNGGTQTIECELTK